MWKLTAALLATSPTVLVANKTCLASIITESLAGTVEFTANLSGGLLKSLSKGVVVIFF